MIVRVIYFTIFFPFKINQFFTNDEFLKTISHKMQILFVLQYRIIYKLCCYMSELLTRETNQVSLDEFITVPYRLNTIQAIVLAFIFSTNTLDKYLSSDLLASTASKNTTLPLCQNVHLSITCFSNFSRSCQYH